MNHGENQLEFFIETFRLIHTNRKKYIYRLETAKFSIAEKRLLKAFLEFYRNHKDKSLALLKTSPLSDPFLEGVRLYLIGLVYNQSTHFEYAVENLEKSVAVFNSIDHHGFIINPVHLLIIAHSNRKEVNRMGVWMRELRKIKPMGNLAHLMILQCEILCSSIKGEPENTIELLKTTEQLKYPEYKAFLPHFLIVHISILVREKRYDECNVVLKKYQKSAENAIVRANYAYIKAMLDHLHKNKPIYVYARKFKEFPELHEQLEVIKDLNAGNLVQANKIWKKLQKHNPELYQDGFHFAGDECLFSQALNRCQEFGNETSWDPNFIKSMVSKFDRLNFLLLNAKEPLQAETMIKLIWEEDLSEQTLTRLRKLISLYAKKNNVKVISSRQSYRLVKK